jgi:hypothetical protein
MRRLDHAVDMVVISVKVWVEVVGPPSSSPQGADDFQGIGGIPVGSVSGSALCGSVWSVAHGFW